MIISPCHVNCGTIYLYAMLLSYTLTNSEAPIVIS